MALTPEMAKNLAPGFDPVPLSKELLRSIRSGTLATLGDTGTPFATLTSVATDACGTPIILVSGLSHHTRHLERDPRCSLLLGQTGKGDPLAHPRLTIIATGVKIDRDSPTGERVRRRFLSHHPKAELYADFPDFSFWRLTPNHFYLNGGFARAWDGPATEVLTDLAECEAFIDLEESALGHLNADHLDAVKLYATRLAQKEDGPWRAAGVDPEGLTLLAGDRTARIPFPRRISTGADLRKTLAELAAAARNAR